MIRKNWAILCVVVVLFAGCGGPLQSGGTTPTTQTSATTPGSVTQQTTTATATATTTPTTSEPSGLIRATVVDSVPEGATVTDATNESIADLDPLRRAIRDSIGRNKSAYVRVTGDQFRAVNESLHELTPYSDRNPDTEDGYYIRSNGTVVAVTLRKEL